MGVWIEIVQCDKLRRDPGVTPLVGVWIEIVQCDKLRRDPGVTPLVGVWIEISEQYRELLLLPSLPLWECGLKYQDT